MTYTTLNTDRKTKLMNDQLNLAQKIQECTDQDTLIALRQTYRDNEEELATFYNDGPHQDK